MSTTSKIFKTSAIVSTALLSLLGACAIDDPIDYTTDGYTAGPQGGGSGDGGNTGSSDGFEATGIATDSSGNVYVTGYTEGALGGSNAGSRDLFVVKYNSAGDHKWTQQLGTSFYDENRGSLARHIATDSSGNVYVTGSVGGDLVVVKYDSDGDRKWTKQFGTSGPDEATGIATDSSGNVYVTGYTWGALDNNTNAGFSDLFVVKYNSAGDHKWTQQLGTSATDYATGIATDSSGNVYVTGYTGGDLDNNTSAGAVDLFVVKYDSAGAKQWTKQLGSSSSDHAYGIATDSSGNVYVTGYTEGAFDNNTNAGDWDLFVVKYDSAGAKQWTQQLGTSALDHALGIATDSSGNVYVTGFTEGAFDNNTNAGYEDLFVVKYNSAGDHKWTQQLGTSSYDHAEGIATDSSGNVYVTGFTDGALDGNTYSGSGDIFVLKLK